MYMVMNIQTKEILSGTFTDSKACFKAARAAFGKNGALTFAKNPGKLYLQ